MKTFGLMVTAALLTLSTAANAHTLRLQCKMTTADNVVCRTIASDGEIARDVEILLIEDKDYTVLATAKTDTGGSYTFKPPAVEYHVVALGDKAHVASLSSVDIW
jgi:hypothetical protein